MPTLMYGGESWPLIEKNLSRIRARFRLMDTRSGTQPLDWGWKYIRQWCQSKTRNFNGLGYRMTGDRFPRKVRCEGNVPEVERRQPGWTT